MASIFDKIVDKQGGARKSASWYRNAINQIATPITAKRLMREKKLIGRPSAGRLNMFFYDPKFKETLPLYDTFPLVLPLEPIKGGFIGMNFHYLPPMARFKMLQRLQAFASNNKFDQSTRLDVSYDDIKNSRLFKPTIKKYLYGYTRSNFLRIDSDEAAISIMLPVQQFKKGRPY
tara:strand:- start:44 stop:568 length:525 start_codon:yes stop_codon:yes gene_type:complete